MKKFLVLMLLGVAVLLSAGVDSNYAVFEINESQTGVDKACYYCGETIEVTVNYTVSSASSFGYDLLVDLYDSGNVLMNSESMYFQPTVAGTYTETIYIDVPCNNYPSPWKLWITIGSVCDYDEYMIYIEDCNVPVTLSSFTAVFADNTPTLQWTTQSESNNLGWNIYRSLSDNMEQTNQINDLLIPGNGTTSEPTQYVYNDLSDVESNTTYWYWLESASYNGETELHGPVTLTIQDNENQLPELPTASVLHNNYPNPFNPSTMINFSINQGENGSLTILNAKGQVMESHEYEAGEHQFNWDAAEYSSGIYFYKLETQNYTNIKKMIMVK